LGNEAAAEKERGPRTRGDLKRCARRPCPSSRRGEVSFAEGGAFGSRILWGLVRGAEWAATGKKREGKKKS